MLAKGMTTSIYECLDYYPNVVKREWLHGFMIGWAINKMCLLAVFIDM